MAMVVPTSGESKFLSWITATANTTLKLFSNSYTPSATDTAGNYTEATFGGYSAQTLYTNGWQTPTIDSNNHAVSTYSVPGQTAPYPLNWNVTSAQTIYGYYVVASDGTLLFAEAFAAARSLQSGDSLQLTPQLTLQSIN